MAKKINKEAIVKKEKELKVKRKKTRGEFKAFINRGSIIDLAVGIIIGSAFTKIVNSFVSDIIMPCINFIIYLINPNSFTEIKTVLREAREAGVDEQGKEITELTELSIKWGLFIEYILTFFIVALAIFWLVKALKGMRQAYDTVKDKLDGDDDAPSPAPAEEPAPAPAPAPVDENTLLLKEIRDLLKENGKKPE